MPGAQKGRPLNSAFIPSHAHIRIGGKAQEIAIDKEPVKMRPRTALYIALMFAGLLLVTVPPAIADTLQISATGLVRRCPCPIEPIDNAEVTAGVLQSKQQNARYFYPVVFPRDGERVCRFTMVYRDINSDETMVARLVRKRFTVGDDAFDAPVVMATLTSAAGVVDAVRRTSTTSITQATINTTNSFYYLEADVPTVNLDILGFQILVAPAC